MKNLSVIDAKPSNLEVKDWKSKMEKPLYREQLAEVALPAYEPYGLLLILTRPSDGGTVTTNKSP